MATIEVTVGPGGDSKILVMNTREDLRNGLFHWTLVVLKADERRRFDALRIGLLCCLRVPNIRFDLRLL